MRGVATSQLTFRVRLASASGAISEGAAVIFSGAGASLPTFYVTDVQKDGRIASVTAYDCCKNLDIPFDYSNYDQWDSSGQTGSKNVKWYNTSQVLGDLTQQCGFVSASLSMRVTSLCWNDFAGKTCRQILEDLSVAECGFFYCDSSNQLAIRTIQTPYGTAISEANRTEIKVTGTKSITGIYAEDEAYGTVSITGTSDWRHTEIVSGRYMNSTVAAAVAAQILGAGTAGTYSYHGWELGQAVVGSVQALGDGVAYDGKVLMMYSQRYRFGAVITGSFGAEKPDNSYSEYNSLYEREIADRVRIGSLFGCGMIDKSGFSLIGQNTAVINSG